MDALDFKIISLLLGNARMTLTELAAQLNLSIPAVTERMRKLEERTIIQGYSANLDYCELGFALSALIFVTLAHPQYRSEFVQKIQNIDAVLECVHITGDDDYMLKVICINNKHLDELLNDNIKSISGITKTRTMIILSTQKERISTIPEVIKKGIK